MAKRATVRYVGARYSRHTAMKLIPEGTEFKAVEALDAKGNVHGVYIRGSNLTKASKGKHKFKAKQYLFLIRQGKQNAMEAI